MDVSLDELIKSKKSLFRRSYRGKPGNFRGFHRGGRGRGSNLKSNGSGGRGLMHEARYSNGYNVYSKNNVNALLSCYMTYGGFNTQLQTSGLSYKAYKIIITNLNYQVTSTDLQELFREFGIVEDTTVYYDVHKRSLGVAEIIFHDTNNVLNAYNQYKNIPLHGNVMKTELIINMPTISYYELPVVTNPLPATYHNKSAQDIGGRIRGNIRRGHSKNLGNFRGQVRSGIGAKNNERKFLNKDELDAELENYIRTNKNQKY